ncbi:MAG: hypothetical protein IJK98_08465 [Clostridia bacterium]|nr:hypothetical protein [Clostridia bacterium]
MIFTVFHPIDFQSLTYYNVSILCAFSIGWLLFGGRTPNAAALITVGVALACCVLAEPPTILLYLLYTLFVPISLLTGRKKDREKPVSPQLLSVRSWGWITVGVAAVACVFFAAVLSSADLKTVLKSAPGILRFLKFHPQTNQWQKFSDYFFKTGYACNIAAALLLALTGALKAAGKLPQAKGPLFAVACLVFIWMTAELYFRWGRIQSALYLPVYQPIPLVFLGLTSFLLAKKKQKRIFAFFCFGLAFAFCMDLLSRVTILTGAIVSAPAAVLLFRETLLETFARLREKKQPEKGTQKKNRRGKSLLKGIVCVPTVLALLVLVVSESAYCFHARFCPSPEIMTKEPMTERAERGPMKGLITIPTIKDEYDAVLRDMDRLKEAPPSSLFTADFMLWCNLYMDLPYATFGHDSFDTPESHDCLLYYWSLHPDAKPECVYIPFFGCDNYRDHPEQTQTVLTFMKSVCDCDVEKGEAGYILRNLRWK